MTKVEIDLGQTNLRELVKEEVRSILNEVLTRGFHGIADRPNGSPRKARNGTTKKAKARKMAKPKVGSGKKAAKKSTKDMQCRHETKAGKRCTERSKGPRFKYMCQKHRD